MESGHLGRSCAIMLLGFLTRGVLCSGCRRHKMLTPRARPKGVPVFMSRFGFFSRLATPIVLFFGVTLMAPGVLAQQDSKTVAAPSGQAGPTKVDQTEDQSGDPLKRPISEKR